MSAHAQARVVLCGGIGSGKSTAGKLLGAAGAEVIDADEVGHRVLEPAGVAFGAVAARWPQVVVDGVIDRSALGRIVFADPGQLGELEAITHPAIRSAILSRLTEAAAAVTVVEIPLLRHFLGEGWQRAVVDCPDDVRRKRLLARGMTTADISQRMASQPSREDWLEAADFVIDNSGSVEELEKEVERFLAALMQRP
jgi:dephospho-CoA kinase